MKIKYFLLLLTLSQAGLVLKGADAPTSFGFSNDGPDPFVQVRGRNRNIAEQKEKKEQKQNAAQVPAEYIPSMHVTNFSEDFMERDAQDSKTYRENERIVDCLPGALSDLIFTYGFEIDDSSPEALCESLTDYILMLRAKFPEIAEQIILQLKSDKLVKKFLKYKNIQLFGPFREDTPEEDKIFSEINIKDEQGHTALHIAAIKGYPGTAAILIANDIDINALATRECDLSEFQGFEITSESEKKIKEIIEPEARDIITIKLQSWHAVYYALLNDYADITSIIMNAENIKPDILVQSVLYIGAERIFSESEAKRFRNTPGVRTIGDVTRGYLGSFSLSMFKVILYCKKQGIQSLNFTQLIDCYKKQAGLLK